MVVNAARWTLASAITSTTANMLTVNGTVAPAIGSTITIDNEQMTVTAVSVNTAMNVSTWTVTRHVNGTTAATHLAGVTVLDNVWTITQRGGTGRQRRRTWPTQP